jgi:hypothetical protein
MSLQLFYTPIHKIKELIMDDLDTYRCRIGTFQQVAKFRRCVGRDFHGGKRFVFSTVFLVVIGLRVLCSQTDPSIEQNPGPSPTNSIIFESHEERTSFNSARGALTSIAKASSHHYFLTFCKSLNILPRVLSDDGTFSIFTPSPETQQLLQLFRRKSHHEELNILIEHLSNVLSQLKTDKMQTLATLASTCNSERYNTLLTSLEQHSAFEYSKMMKIKEKKLNALLDSNRSTITKENSWIPELQLTSDHYTAIKSNTEICDTVINAAMTFL